MSAAVQMAAGPGKTTGRPKILAVDDRPENLMLIRAILSKMEAELIYAASGPEALATLEDHEVALILLDVSMPDMDGFEVARRLQADDSRSPIPIIFLTGAACAEKDVMDGYAAGVVDFLFKPFHPVILRSKVQVFLNLYEERKLKDLVHRALAALPEQVIARNERAESAAREIALQKAELEQRNRELLARNRELDSFAYVVSHDLRQPLQAILNYVDLTETHAHGDENVARWLASCRKLGQSMQGLITDVLDFATLGAETVDLQPIDCNAPLFQAIESLLPEIERSGACIAYDDLPCVLGSERLLARMFQNLIANAIKYRSDLPPRIQIRSEWDESRATWSIRVIDNGRGIARSEATRVFEMLARCPEAAEASGNGIGLAVCKRIAEAHGGRIWVNSELNQGSEFVFVLREAGPDTDVQLNSTE